MKYRINFEKLTELPNKTLEFKVENERNEVVGIAISSSINSFGIIDASLDGISEFDRGNLEKELKKFCSIYYHQKGDTDETSSA